MIIHWNWGHSIALVYSIFALATLTFVFYAFTQKVELQDQNYYELGVNHESVIQSKKNIIALGDSVDFTIENHFISLKAPISHSNTEGELTFISPISQDFDFHLNFKFDDNGHSMTIIPKKAKGNYTIRAVWTKDSKRYLIEKTSLIND